MKITPYSSPTAARKGTRFVNILLLLCTGAFAVSSFVDDASVPTLAVISLTSTAALVIVLEDRRLKSIGTRLGRKPRRAELAAVHYSSASGQKASERELQVLMLDAEGMRKARLGTWATAWMGLILSGLTIAFAVQIADVAAYALAGVAVVSAVVATALQAKVTSGYHAARQLA
jgi:hypothetical protein